MKIFADENIKRFFLSIAGVLAAVLNAHAENELSAREF